MSERVNIQAQTNGAAQAHGGVLQRKCDCGTHSMSGECAACGGKHEGILQRRAADPAFNAAENEAPPIVHETVRSPGRPLDARARSLFEPRFGKDFSNVRVHTDARAAESAKAVNALAYTVGNNIVFAQGNYSPSTADGQRLLAHELVHTVQQPSYVPLGRLSFSGADDPAEREASHLADNLSGAAVSATSGAMLQRQAAGNAPPPPAQGQSAQPAPPAGARQTPPSPRSDLHSIINITRNGFGRYNAELDRRPAARNQPCQLTLSTKIQFTPRGAWPAGRFQTWQQEFIWVVRDRWSFRFLLAPVQACQDEPCRLATAIVDVIPVTSNAYHTVNVDYVKPERARSNVGTPGDSQFYEQDVRRGGRDLRQGHATATHEFGHMLGLQHVHCNSSDDDCYGTDREESADVMGRGEIVTARDYAPFAEAISDITGCPWRPQDHGGGRLFGNYSTGLAIFGGLLGAVAGIAAGFALGPLAGLAIGALAAVGGAGIGFGIGSLLD